MSSVAVVGAGVAGLSTAYLLHRAGHQVTLYESENRCGGHAWTVGEGDEAVDVGFQVFNLTTYPNLVALFRELEVGSEEAELSVSYSVEQFEWSTETLRTLFPTLKSCIDKDHVAMVIDIFRFGHFAPQVLTDPQYNGMSLEGYLKFHRFSSRLMTSYIGPMISAMWLLPESAALQLPIQTVVQFFVQQQLLNTLGPQPDWRTVRGHSKMYVEAILKRLPDVKSGTAIVAAERKNDGVTLKDQDGTLYKHDHVVFATHPPDTLRILGEDAREDEREVLGAFKFEDYLCVLHNDTSFMPSDPLVWAAWNFVGLRPDGAPEPKQIEPSACCTHWLNRIQNLPEGVGHRFLTLNPVKPVPPTAVLGQFTFAHLVYNHTAVANQRLPDLQGKNRTWFAGAWTRYGFHEDGVQSAVNVVALMGAKLPWKAPVTSNPVPTVASLVAGHLRLLLPEGSTVGTCRDTAFEEAHVTAEIEEHFV